MAYAEQIQALERRSVAAVPAAEASDEGGDPVAEAVVDPHPRRPLEREHYFARKWLLERVLGSLLLVPASPLILFLCLLVRATSRGPGLYRQVRLGYQGQPYEILKIRTMTIDAEADGVARWCTKNDPRVTRLGRWLRKLHLDELPQLINVARGEMALVGPRPERPQISANLAKEIEGYYDRLAVLPGITGLAQINLPPDETLDDARRKQILDLQYIEEAGLWIDLRMLVATGLRMCGISGNSVIRAMWLCRKATLDGATSYAAAPRDAADEANFEEEMLSGELGRLTFDGVGSCPSSQGDYPRRPR